ncbi:MAG: hypothetical protein V2J07_01140 [Anaerolineae bacterium]|jgi:hypothetical protein|nr:hypothetical protein [Anaerolineae bacterium]
MTNMIRNEQPRSEESTNRFGSAYLFTGALIGLVLGLILSLAFFRLRWVDITPASLTFEDQKEYVSAVALCYDAEKDIGRARARLEMMEPSLPLPNFVNQFGSHVRADDNGPSHRMLSIYYLAIDLSDGAIQLEGLEEYLNQDEEEASPVEETEPEEESALPTATLEMAATQPTQTMSEESSGEESEPITEDLTPPDPVAQTVEVNDQPFQLAERLNFCDQNLAKQLQVEVLGDDGVPLQGVQIFIQWDGGTETFFTGLYPEINDGYADFDMTGEIIYQLQVGAESLFVDNIQGNLCELGDGTTYFGGVWLKFRPESES